MNQVLGTLKRARRRIADPERYHPRHLAVDRNGAQVSCFSPLARRWSVTGAVAKAIERPLGSDPMASALKLYAQAARELGVDPLGDVDQADALRVLDLAIEYAERKAGAKG